jgi:hypothetical protein
MGEQKLSTIVPEVSSKRVTIRLHGFSIPALSFVFDESSVTVAILPCSIL